MFCNNWGNVKLQDVAHYSKERIELQKVNKLNYISTENMLSEKGGITEASSLPKVKSLTKYDQGDTLISNIRPYFKKIWYADKTGGTSNDVLVFKTNNLIHSKFLYYYLSQDSFFDYMTKTAKGTKMPRGDKQALMNIKLNLPSLEEQKAISDIFSSLDERIELNNQMNETLEEMAQALFKRWFVDFEFPNDEGQPYRSSGGEMIESELGMIPKGWKIASLKDYCTEITRGQTPKYVESSELLVLNQKVNKGRILEKQYFKFLNPDLQVPQNKYCRKWDVLLNSLGQGTLGRVHLYKEKTDNVVVDQHITIIRSNKFESIYLYNLLNTSQYQGRLDSLVSGSTGMLMLNISKIREMCIISPSYELVVKFGQILESTYENIATNEYINEKLVHIRNSLLPKLMSGEIRVSDLES